MSHSLDIGTEFCNAFIVESDNTRTTVLLQFMSASSPGSKDDMSPGQYIHQSRPLEAAWHKEADLVITLYTLDLLGNSARLMSSSNIVLQGLG